MKGRPPTAAGTRKVFLRVRLAPSEAEKLDRQREEQSRSDFVRDLIAKDAKRRRIT